VESLRVALNRAYAVIEARDAGTGLRLESIGYTLGRRPSTSLAMGVF